jgi:hypothetical protein
MTDDPIPLDEARTRRKGKGAAREAILHAAPATAPPASQDSTPAEGGSERLQMHGDGLYLKPSEDKRAYRISGFFEALSETHDDDAQAWGLLIRFPDRDHVVQQVILPRDLFAGEGVELCNMLARRGVYINPSSAARAGLNEYLSKLATPKRARVVSRTGWHHMDGVRVFVLPTDTKTLEP